MTRKGIKITAIGIAAVFGLTLLLPLAAHADVVSGGVKITISDQDTNPNNTIFSLGELKKLAVANNRTKDQLTLNMKLLEESRMQVANKKSETVVDTNIAAGSKALDPAMVESLQQQIAALKAKDPDGKDLTIQSQIIFFQTQLSQLLGTEAVQQSATEGLIDAQKDLQNQLNTITNNKETLARQQADWQKEVELLASKLYFNGLTMERSIALTRDQLAIAENLQKVEDLKKRLGMAIDSDTKSKALGVETIKSQLAAQENALKMLKRQINDLIGRDRDAELTLQGTELTLPADAAPVRDAALVKTFTDNSATIDKLNREIDALRAEVQSLKDRGKKNSDTYATYDRNIEMKQLEIKEEMIKAETTVAASFNTLAEKSKTYTDKIQAASNAEKIRAEAALKYERGVIAKLVYEQSVLAAKTAELEKWQAVVAYYLALEEYYARKDGLSLASYSMF